MHNSVRNLVGISYGLFYEHHFTTYLDKVIQAIQSKNLKGYIHIRPGII